MNPLLAVRFGAPDEHKRKWSAVGIETRVKATVERLDAHVEGRSFLVGPTLTLADISVVTALIIWTRGLGQALPDGLKRYRDRLQERPAYKRAMAGGAKR